ncbi:MAG: hypothetical protein LBI61_02845 [Puniceicoccales bacterium]|jgi:hypothetical protein|nr:hypothetical protein [Puniceicoccales bacterium]
MLPMTSKGRGVALIFVAMIAVLIGGIFAGIGTINYIWVLHARRDSYANAAKNNALFALGLAVEKLQRLSGNDMRVTAPAQAVADVIGHKKYRTGVWSTEDAELGVPPKFLGWLVSDENSENFESIWEDKTGVWVKVFSSGGSDDVCVSPISIVDGSTTVGKCGFWIADESQKVKINAVDRYFKSVNFRAKKVRHCCPQAFDRGMIFGKNSGLENDFILTKVDFPEQLAYLDRSAFEKYSQNGHAFTLHSHGVLSNSRSGGLRRDLSRLAESGATAKQLLFPRQTDLPAYVPTLGFALSFFNLPRESRNGYMAAIATDPPYMPQAFADYAGATADSPDDDLQSATIHGVFPLLVQANVSIGVANVDGRFAFTFVPQIALWNPYSVDLQRADYSVELLIRPPNGGSAASLTLLAFNDAQQSFSKIGIFPIAIADGKSFPSKVLKLNFSTDLGAGEVKIFSLANSQPVNFDGGNAMSNVGGGQHFAYVDSGVPARGHSAFRLSCTNGNGNVNVGWNCFGWRLIHGQSGKILQEIDELDHLDGSVLECERAFAEGTGNCFSFSARMKCGIPADASGNCGVRWLANCNPRAPHIGRAVCQEYSSILGQNAAAGNWNFTCAVANSTAIAQVNGALVDYLSDLVLFDVPDAVCGVLNVGYLRHANFAPLGYFPSEIFCSSRANPLIPLHKTFHENSTRGALWPSRGRVESLYDYSYLLNDALLDGYFVSTKNSPDAIDADLSCLANRRFKLLSHAKSANCENVAEILLVDGPFNVNTCEAIPWECALSSVKNSYGEMLFPRFYSEKTVDKFPSFDERKVRNLAEAIGASIRQRSQPFSGVGNFANRFVSQNPWDCTRAGVLQTAIDESGINSDCERTRINFAKALPLWDDASASGYLEENLPNMVNQGDILQEMAHFLCARGDTFLVRAFGDHVNNSGKTMERAYCEAIVQRVPEYVCDRENFPGDAGDALSETNGKFGRRYKVILFRWLSCDAL